MMGCRTWRIRCFRIGGDQAANNLPGIATLGPCCPAGEPGPLQVDVEIRDQASADDYHGAAARRMQMFDELQESGIDLDSVRSIGNVEEGTVEIEEIGPVAA